MLTPVQKKLLDMLKWFHEYCRKHRITYYAAGGTMIGAARHHGFIPWDDDIDVVVPREDYKRLISQFISPADGYYLETPYSGSDDYLYSYAKLYDTETVMTEKTRHACKRGVYMDVFPLDGIGNSIEEAEHNFQRVDKKNMFLMMRTCAVRKERSWYKNLSIILARIIPDFAVNDKELSMDVDRLASEINRNNSVYVANLMGTYRSREITMREYYGTPALYQFEDTFIFGPEKYDEYLTHIYKNWRELPPEDERITAHDCVELDLKKPYLG